MDGTSRGRIDGRAFDLRVSPDGEYAYVWLEAEPGRAARVSRCSLVDGAVSPVADPPRGVDPRYGRQNFSTIQRTFEERAGPPARVVWRDPDGRCGWTPLAASEVLLDASDDAARVVIGHLVDGWVEALRVVRVDDDATLCALPCPPLLSTSVRLHGRFVFGAACNVVRAGLAPGAAPLVRVRIDDGDVASARNPGAFNTPWCMERGGERAAVALQGSVAVYDLDTLREVASFSSPFPRVEDFARGVLLVRDAAFRERPLSLCDFASGELHALPITREALLPRLTPDGGRVVSRQGAFVCVHDIATGRHISFHDGPDAYAQHVAWSPDGGLVASVSFDGVVRVLDVRSGALAWAFEGPPSMFDDHSPTRLAFSPDGRWLYAASAHGISTWSLATGEERAYDPGGGTAVCDAVVSPDGRLLAALDFEGDAPRVVLHDTSAAMRPVARHPLAPCHAMRDVRLSFDAAGRPALFVRDWQHAGQAALLGVDVNGHLSPTARRSLRRAAQVVPLDGVGALHLDRGALSWIDLWSRASSEARRGPGFTFESLLDARAGVAAFVVRDAAGPALALTDLRGERVLGFVRNERAVIGGALSPDGRRLAVRYAATGVEVFEREPATATPPG